VSYSDLKLSLLGGSSRGKKVKTRLVSIRSKHPQPPAHQTWPSQNTSAFSQSSHPRILQKVVSCQSVPSAVRLFLEEETSARRSEIPVTAAATAATRVS
jgi:hypothetical protein